MLTKTVEETARGLEALEFLALLAEENSLSALKENVTLLLPTDKAVEEYEELLAQQNGLGKTKKIMMEKSCLKGQFHEIFEGCI